MVFVNLYLQHKKSLQVNQNNLKYLLSTTLQKYSMVYEIELVDLVGQNSTFLLLLLDLWNGYIILYLVKTINIYFNLRPKNANERSVTVNVKVYEYLLQSTFSFRTNYETLRAIQYNS